MNCQVFLDKKVFVTPVIKMTPTKVTDKNADGSDDPPNQNLLPIIQEANKRSVQDSSERKKKKNKSNPTGTTVRTSARHGAGQTSNKS